MIAASGNKFNQGCSVSTGIVLGEMYLDPERLFFFRKLTVAEESYIELA